MTHLNGSSSLIASFKLSKNGMNSREINEYRSKIWRRDEDSIKTFYDGNYSNWIDLDGAHSKWSLKINALEQIRSALARRQTYLDLKIQGKAAPAANIGLSTQYINDKCSKFKQYCPYSLLADQSFERGLPNLLVEYKDQFYYCSTLSAAHKFMDRPEDYMIIDLPVDMPQRSFDDSRDIAFKGYCPVTFQEGPTG